MAVRKQPVNQHLHCPTDAPVSHLEYACEYACVLCEARANGGRSAQSGLLSAVLASSFLCAATPGKSFPRWQASTLNLLINLADINQESQDALSTPEAAAAIHPLLRKQDSPRVVCAACLLLSHVVWNHKKNQVLLPSHSHRYES